MKLPGQDTTTALSPERAERLRKLYEEELVRRVKEKRPEARLWGGADDQPHIKTTQEKGIAFEDFRWVRAKSRLWAAASGFTCRSLLSPRHSLASNFESFYTHLSDVSRTLLLHPRLATCVMSFSLLDLRPPALATAPYPLLTFPDASCGTKSASSGTYSRSSTRTAMAVWTLPRCAPPSPGPGSTSPPRR